MKTIVLLVENLGKARSLEAALKPLGSVATLNLLDARSGRVIPPSASTRLVVSEASSGSSRALTAIEAFLRSYVSDSTPHILLLPDSAPRPRWVNGSTRETRILDPGSGGKLLSTALAFLGEGTPESLAVTSAVCESAQFISDMFAAGRPGGPPIEPDTIASGSDLILQTVVDAKLEAWVDVVRRFDDAVHQHCLLVAGLVGGLTNFLGFRMSDRQRLTQASLVHDIGKSKIPTAILSKPGALTSEEREVISTHPALGYEMLVGRGFPDEILATVRSHHELLDGSGYPDGLRGSEIPDMVRLVTICDIFAALIEERSYKPGLSPEESLSMLQGMGPKIDQVLLRACRGYLLSASASTKLAIGEQRIA